MGMHSMGGPSMGGPPIFGNGEYYQDSSEDFHTVSRGDRYRRRDGLLGGYDAIGDQGRREVFFGARRNYKGYGEGNRNGGGSLAYPDHSYGGDFGNDKFRRGGVGSGMARPQNIRYNGGYCTGSLRLQHSFRGYDDYGPSPQEMRGLQPGNNQLARYGKLSARSQNSSNGNNNNNNNNFCPNNN